jgi:hypothetical protein
MAVVRQAERSRASARRMVCQHQTFLWSPTKRAQSMCGQLCSNTGRSAVEVRHLAAHHCWASTLGVFHTGLFTHLSYMSRLVKRDCALPGADRGAAGGAGRGALQGQHAVAR